MKRTIRIQHLGVFLLSSVLVACGAQQKSPIAFKRVEPETGSTKALGLQPENLSSTLLEEVVKNGVPAKVAAVAFAKYDQFQANVKNTGWIAAIDFTKASGTPRMFMINTATGAVDKTLVAHGSGSDPGNTGTPTKFSNIPNSKTSSLGAYIVAEKFQSSVHGTAARLDGLESTNSYARPRAIILHSATYVTPARTKMGMSWGCPAVALNEIATALKRLSGGAFMYAYAEIPSATALDEMHTQQMMMDPTFNWINESEEAPLEGVGGD